MSSLSTVKTLGLRDWRAQVFVLAALFVAAFASGAWFLGTGIETVARTSDILANGERASAQVIAIDESVPDPAGAPQDVYLTTTVSFFTAAGEPVDAVLPAAGVQPDYAIGDQVEVVFHSDEPERVVVDDESVLAGQSVAIWIGGILLLISVVPAVFAVRAWRRGRIMGA